MKLTVKQLRTLISEGGLPKADAFHLLCDIAVFMIEECDFEIEFKFDKSPRFKDLVEKIYVQFEPQLNDNVVVKKLVNQVNELYYELCSYVSGFLDDDAEIENNPKFLDDVDFGSEAFALVHLLHYALCDINMMTMPEKTRTWHSRQTFGNRHTVGYTLGQS